MAKFRIHPKALADSLANAVDIGKDKASLALIYLRASGDTLHVYGRGRYTAGRDSRPFTADEPQYGEVVITEAEAEELASITRNVEGAGRKETLIGVEILERQTFKVEFGEEVLCDLPDADTEEQTFGMPDEVSDWEEVDEMLAEVAKHPEATQPLAFQKDVLARMNKIRADSNVMDIASHPHGHAAGIALGSTFRGLVAAVGRDGYKSGGKWGDGPGKPSHLWE